MVYLLVLACVLRAATTKKHKNIHFFRKKVHPTPTEKVLDMPMLEIFAVCHDRASGEVGRS